MSLRRRERQIAALALIAAAVIGLTCTSAYLTPDKPTTSTLYQLILITLAGNWNPLAVDPNWLNGLTAVFAVLLNLGSLAALFGIFKYVMDQKERNMKAIDLLEIFDHLVTARVSSDVAREFHLEAEADKVRLNKVVADAVQNTKALWEKKTVPNMLRNPREIERFRKSLDQQY